jgi:hypothetical protein
LLCNFAKGFLEAHPGGELAGDDAHHRLVLIVACAHLETVGIEHGHSKTRRKVVGQSVQTYRVSLGYVNAQLFAERHRGVWLQMCVGPMRKPLMQKERTSAPQPVPRPLRGGGGK